jgi:sporulation protein YlmC with PRC-barrel domain
MKTEWYAPLAAAFCLMLAYGSSVQPDGERTSDALDRQIERIENAERTLPLGACKATDVVGRTVHNPQGERLGTIEDVVFDPGADPAPMYVVMSFGGFLDRDEKRFAIPWSELEPSRDRRGFVLGLPREAFERARGIEDVVAPALAATVR